MEIKDLVGISKPLTKFLEVISKGLGAVSRPYLIRREADAKAYEIKVLSAAISEASRAHGVPVDYKDGKIEARSAHKSGELQLEWQEVTERGQKRIEFQEIRRQENIESVTSKAAVELAAVTTVADDPVDEDWIARFFSSAQDISSDQMQNLWARILAGEIARPGKFSLRTLDFLRNLTQKEAALLEKVAKFAVTDRGVCGIAVLDKKKFVEQFGVLEADLFELGELGVLYQTQLTLTTFVDEATPAMHFLSGKKLLKVERQQIKLPVQIPMWKFTAQGAELLELIEVAGDELYLEYIGKHFVKAGGKVIIAEFQETLPDGGANYRIIKEVS